MPPHDPPELAELYDPATLARIEAASVVASGVGGVLDDRAASGDGPEPGDPLEPDGDDWTDAARWSEERAGRTRVRNRFGLAGAVMAGVMLGVAVVYDPEPDKPTVIEQDADGEPFDGLPVQVHIDPADPRNSRIILRAVV